MEDPNHLEKMGRELKCPICLSLLNSAVSLSSCNHVFCNLCIMQSMKSDSSCPVCKVPYQRREIRPAPHMDNLASIYRSMEIASGFNIFVTQTAPVAKSQVEKVKQVEDGTCSDNEDTDYVPEGTIGNRKPRNGKRSVKGARKKQKVAGPAIAKPSFPTKKRVQVPQYPLSETPIRDKKLQIGSQVKVNKVSKSNPEDVTKKSPVTDENGELVLSPLFWLRDDDPERSTQSLEEDEFLSLTPLSIPSFSDIKDSSDYESPTGEADDDPYVADDSDGELFGCTQRPASTDRFSVPVGKQVKNNRTIDQILKETSDGMPQTPTDESGSMRTSKRKSKKKISDGTGRTMRRCSEINSGKCVNKQGAPTTESGELCRKRAHSKANIGKRDQGNYTEESELRTGPVITEEAVNLADSTVDVWGTSFSNCQGSNGNHKTKKAEKVRRNMTQQSECPSKLKKQKLEKICERNKQFDEGKQHRVSFSGVHVIGEPSSIGALKTSGNNSKLTRESHSNEIAEDCCKGRSCRTDKANPRIYTSSFAKETVELAAMDKMGKASALIENQPDETKTKGKGCVDIPKTDFLMGLKKRKKVPSPKVLAASKKSISDASKKTNNHCETQCTKNKLAQGDCKSSANKHKIIKCAFCHSPNISEASGEMVHYCNGRPVTADYVGLSKVIHCHKSCAEWAPNVYFEDDTAVNLEAELARSRRIKCSCCDVKGASLGCYEKTCRKSFHVPCARLISECRWDTENFVMLCPIHTSAKLPNEERQGSLAKTTNQHLERQKSNKCKQGFEGSLSRFCRSVPCSPFDKLVLCCSALTPEEKEIVAEFERTSGARILKKLDPSVTHVIASTDMNGACKRTVKTLMGILWGKWILNIDWIKDCTKAKEIVDEARYEIKVDIHGIKDGPLLGRLRILNKQPKLLEGFKFYFTGDFIPSYKGYLQDLIIAAGGSILHRKPIPEFPESSAPSTLVIYNVEVPEKCNPTKKDAILRRRQSDAKALAESTGSKAVSNLWVLNSIAACQLQTLPL